jgi:predicted dehydrogenase
MSEKNKIINVGIVGMGRAGGGMLSKELGKRPEKFKISAVCDISEEQCKPYAEQFGAGIYMDINDIVKDEKLDLISISTRSIDHFRHAVIALNAGKNVFLEKPITLNYEDAAGLCKIAENSRGRLFLRHNRRFEPAFQHIMEIIAEGTIGDVFEVKLRRLNYQRRDDWQTIIKYGGGQLNNWGPHIIDHALRFLDSPVAEIWSDLKKIAAAGDAEDHLKIILKGRNSRIVDLEISGGAAIREPEYIIFGTKGGIMCKGEDITLKYLDPSVKLEKKEAKTETPKGYKSEELKWIEKTFKAEPASKCNTDSIWDAIYETMSTGKEFPIKLEQGLEVMRVIDEVKRGTPFEG